jgi:hypothetical protein
MSADKCLAERSPQSLLTLLVQQSKTFERPPARLRRDEHDVHRACIMPRVQWRGSRKKIVKMIASAALA